MHRATILALKALTIVMFALMLFSQVFVIPAVAAQSAARYAEIAFLRIPGVIVGLAFIVCVQVVLLCVWRLLSLVREDRIFSEQSYVYVDVSLGAVVVATLLILGCLLTFSSVGVLSASITLLCVLGLVVGAGLSLLIVVMRALLRKASQLEQDLAEVV